MNNYDELVNKLAARQYARLTGRKWESASLADKSLWTDGAAKDLSCLGIKGEGYDSYTILPPSLDDQQAINFAESLSARLPHSKMSAAVQATYSEFFKKMKFQKQAA